MAAGTGRVTSATMDHFGTRGDVGVRLDCASGLPVALLRRDEATPPAPLSVAVTLVTGGDEVHAAVGGLEYPGAVHSALDDLRLLGTRLDDEGSASRLTVSSATDGWTVEWEYRFNERPPHVELGLTLRRADGAGEENLRNVLLVFATELERAGDWVLNAPGNQWRADLPVDEIATPLIPRGAGEGEGSPGILALSRRSEEHTTLLWPLCQTEMSEMELRVEDGRLELEIATAMAGRLSPETPGITWRTMFLDSLPSGWAPVRAMVPQWWRELGLAGPTDTPQWLKQANVYEAYIGYAVFFGDHRYECYPTVADLRADLPRILGLGFDVLQLMPRHPYPSYNVHDYDDVTTTYGDEDELRELFAECHRLGMKVLLDIIMHGVIDKEVMDETLASVRSGPYADCLDDDTIDPLARRPEDLGWARHIVDFAPYWRAGAPDRHHLVDEHPEWFCRDSDGNITRRYTKAFDASHPGWQQYFMDCCADLVRRLGIDGFRIDAPMYNWFPNWAPGRTGRTSYPTLAPIAMLRELRMRLRAEFGDVVVYSEVVGSLWRAATDGTYNYDEAWLIEALFDDHPNKDHPSIHNGAELARWLEDRDETLPPGATILHHVDSHDSVWWRRPGKRFRIERFGHPATVALISSFGLIGGAYMTFMGGEAGVEDELRRVHELRHLLPEVGHGTVDYTAASCASEDVFTLVRSSPEGSTLVAVSFSDGDVACEIVVPGMHLGARLHDHWNHEWIVRPRDAAPDRLELRFEPFQPRVVRLTPAATPIAAVGG